MTEQQVAAKLQLEMLIADSSGHMFSRSSNRQPLTERPEQVGLPHLVYISPGQHLFDSWMAHRRQGVKEGFMDNESRKIAIRESCEFWASNLMERGMLDRMTNAYVVGEPYIMSDGRGEVFAPVQFYRIR